MPVPHPFALFAKGWDIDKAKSKVLREARPPVRPALPHPFALLRKGGMPTMLNPISSRTEGAFAWTASPLYCDG
jgi:hypothetical protein